MWIQALSCKRVGKKQEEARMLQVTEKADEMLKDFFKDREGTPYLRIFLSQGGWSGPSLGMALDEPREEDEVIKDNGITYLIEKQLFEQVKPINIDFVSTAMGSGFSISSNLKTDGGCGSSCSTCWKKIESGHSLLNQYPAFFKRGDPFFVSPAIIAPP
jgi:iron-sulfur cluster assembly protein